MSRFCRKKKEMFGYHTKKITAGDYGEFSKIKEEFEELEDAVEQDDRILILCELCDLYGALEGYADSLGFSMYEIKSFSDKTKEAFKNGGRITKPSSTDNQEPIDFSADNWVTVTKDHKTFQVLKSDQEKLGLIRRDNSEWEKISETEVRKTYGSSNK